MKQAPSLTKLLCGILLILGMAGCTKEHTVYIDAPYACFTVQTYDPYGSFLINNQSTFVDSSFYFRNCSDSSADISYKWDFGDGTTSELKHPKHRYTKRGQYKVSLFVSNAGKAFDTVSVTLFARMGQQLINQGEKVNLSPVAVVENPDLGFTVLASKDYNTGQFLYHLDSLMKQVSMKTLPSGYRLNAMTRSADGNYVFTGNTNGSDQQNQLIKLSPDGTLLWSKQTGAAENYLSAISTLADGGYGIVGTRPVPAGNGNFNYHTLLRKTDGDGNVQWEKLLDREGMLFSGNAVFEQDGAVVAGVKRAVNGCLDCDSLLIVKVNNSGQVVWQNTVFWGLNWNNWLDTKITKIANGNYAVANGSFRGLYYFSPGGVFLDRRLAVNRVHAMAGLGDSKIVVMEEEPGNGFRMIVNQYDLQGVQGWTVRPDGRLKIGNGYSCCSSSWPRSLLPLRKGGYLATAEMIRNNYSTGSYYSEMLLLQVDESGNIK
ncbi:PKD domain-containing protein [Paraflavitalea pollutisoli]|uniref:PKD domain-containing protein n=1 Tax=Paraflavitalea pollutisoli TaxID=3034143 RepID=UPI0023ECFF0F|nr:PKD domain-containing protein [Paraflavitalea sp. H1-2-19X]